MNSYRIEWTQIKPGGTKVQQCDHIRGDRSDVVRFLSRDAGRIVPGSVNVTEHITSDGNGTSLGSLGF